jgi:hypothetical protein
MKVIILLLIVILIFFGCATLGYQLATMQESAKVGNRAGEIDDLGGEQHNLIIMRVDQLDGKNPRLISVWFVSLYFFNDNPSSLTLAQLYPPKTPTNASKALERAFALTSAGDPVAGFWSALEGYKIKWEGYVMVDTAGASEVLTWLVGPGDYSAILAAAEADQNANKQLVEQICGSIVSAGGRDIGLFNWTELVPQHFRSSLRMEAGLAYWARMTSAEKQVRCEILMAP